MRFTVKALSAIASAGILLVTHPGAAHAAQGDLYIGKKRIENAVGCYPYRGGPVKNSTTGPVTFWTGHSCNGRQTTMLMSGFALLRAQGRSILVP